LERKSKGVLKEKNTNLFLTREPVAAKKEGEKKKKEDAQREISRKGEDVFGKSGLGG